MAASCTPCERSSTSSRFGQRVAAIRRRKSSSAASGIATENGRMAPAACWSTVGLVFATVVLPCANKGHRITSHTPEHASHPGVEPQVQACWGVAPM